MKSRFEGAEFSALPPLARPSELLLPDPRVTIWKPVMWIILPCVGHHIPQTKLTNRVTLKQHPHAFHQDPEICFLNPTRVLLKALCKETQPQCTMVWKYFIVNDVYTITYCIHTLFLFELA